MEKIELKLNKKKFEIFLDVAEGLNKKGIIPVMFGSLGLYRIIGESKEAGDVDFLVPGKMIKDDWKETMDLMENNNFVLKDEKEHEFERDNESVAFGNENDLIEMAKINPEKLNITEIGGVRFKELSPEQYLKVYELMLRDRYRQEKKGKNDQEKIELIKNYLAKK